MCIKKQEPSLINVLTLAPRCVPPLPLPHPPPETLTIKPVFLLPLLLCSIQIYIWEAKLTKAHTRGITAALASKKSVSFVSSFYSNRLDRTPTAPQPYQLPYLSRFSVNAGKKKKEKRIT